MYRMPKSERVQKFEEIGRTKICGVISGNLFCVISKKLDEMGYFDVPASLNFHGTFDGGLFAHSLCVAEILDEHTQKLGLKWERYSSPWIIGLFHDLCKCDEYIRSEQLDIHDLPRGWERCDQKILAGHGEKSVMLLSQFMTLTEEEILCIRYHMGAYNTDDWNGFDLAIKKYPNVLYTHTADMLASKVCEA